MSRPPRAHRDGERVAVVGSGVAGLTAAYLLSRRYRVTMFERDNRLGGHAHTHHVPAADGTRQFAVDSGFIVLNDRTYPLLQRLLAELGVATRPTEMSMSIRSERTGLEYAGGRGVRGLTARPRQLLSPTYLRLLGSVRRFHTLARQFLATTNDEDETTFGEFIADGGFPPEFAELFAVPYVSCVWSSGTSDVLDYPARYLFRFLEHHGALSISGSPQWMTVEGGSKRYVAAIASTLDVVRTGDPVDAVLREDNATLVTTDSGTHEFDRVVLATHADTALDLLVDATPEEKEVLGAFRYTTNPTVLHRDLSLLPTARGARASWNYLVRSPETDQPPVVTYWMNRLQGIPETTPVLVTLNAPDLIDPKSVITTMQYEHPIYDLAAIRAQRRLSSLTNERIAFAGAYHGWGFHEDGVRSGVAAAAAFGVDW